MPIVGSRKVPDSVTRKEIEEVKRLALVVACAVALTAGSTMAGVVEFSPPLFIYDPERPRPVEYDVSLGLRAGFPLPGFDAVDIVFGAEQVPFMGFDYDSTWPFATAEPPAFNIGIYPHDMYVTSNDANLATSPRAFGTVMVDPRDLAPGDYIIQVNHAIDGDFSQLLARGTGDPLLGSAVLRVVPEPASLSLLALGALAALHLRKRR